MSERHTVKIQDGSIIEVDPNEWQRIGAPLLTKTVPHDSPSELLTIRRHTDGRTLVYATVRIGKDDETHIGEVLQPGGDIPSALIRVQKRSGVVGWLVDRCLESLDRR